jgi:hypothetical protein
MSVSVYVALTPPAGIGPAPAINAGTLPSASMTVFSLAGGSPSVTGSETVYNLLQIPIPGNVNVPVDGPDTDGAYYIVGAPPTGQFYPSRQ